MDIICLILVIEIIENDFSGAYRRLCSMVTMVVNMIIDS